MSVMARPRGRGFSCTPLRLCMGLVVLMWLGGFLILVRNIKGSGGSRNLDISGSSSISSTAIEAILPYGQQASSQTVKTRGSEAGAKITMPVIKTSRSTKGMESAARWVVCPQLAHGLDLICIPPSAIHPSRALSMSWPAGSCLPVCSETRWLENSA